MPGLKRKLVEVLGPAQALQDKKPAATSDHAECLLVLEAELKEAEGLYRLHLESPNLQLKLTGVCVVRPPITEDPEDEKAFLQALTDRLGEARPLPGHVREALLVGDSGPYSDHWKKVGSAFGLLFSHAMPQPLNLNKAARAAHTDAFGNIFQLNPSGRGSFAVAVHARAMDAFFFGVSRTG